MEPHICNKFVANIFGYSYFVQTYSRLFERGHTGIQTLVFKAIKNGTWDIDGNTGVVNILWKYKGQIIVVTSIVINGIFNISDAWVKR